MKSKNKFLTLKVAKNLNVDKLPLSKGDRIIALFIVSQTNYHTNFDVYVRKFKKLLGRNTLQLDKVFDALVQANIIKLVQAGKFKEQCRTYSMVTPFNVDTDDCEVISFQFEAPGVPTFINRFIADGFTYKEFSKYEPRKKVQALNNENQFKQRIQQLEELLKANDIAVPALGNLPDAIVAMKPVEATEAPVLSIVPSNEKEAIKPSNDGIEQKLTDQLIITPFDGALVINLNNDECYIENYEMMAGWVNNMDVAEQVRLFSTIINEPGTGIVVPIKGKIKAHFIKMRNGEFTKVVYKSVIAA